MKTKRRRKRRSTGKSFRADEETGVENGKTRIGLPKKRRQRKECRKVADLNILRDQHYCRLRL
jgi:hypothetical protein